MHDITRYHWALSNKIDTIRLRQYKDSFPIVLLPNLLNTFIIAKILSILIFKIQYLHSAFGFRRKLRSSLTSAPQPRLNSGVTAGDPRFNRGRTAIDPRSNRYRPDVEPRMIRGYTVYDPRLNRGEPAFVNLFLGSTV